MQSAATVCEHCGAQMPATATAFLVDGKVVCRDCHDTLEPACPTCGERLTERPESTRPCPHCGWPIQVVREQDLFDSTLLSREQFDALAAMRKKLGLLRRLGVTEGMYPRIRAQLSQEAGQDVDDFTVMRRLFHKGYRNAETDEDRASVLYAEARFLHEHGHDYRPVLRRAHRHQLQAYEQAEVDGVRIAGPTDTCAYCKKRAGQPLPLARELQDPELPYPDCPNKTVGSKVFIGGEVTRVGVSKGAFCEARYEPYDR